MKNLKNVKNERRLIMSENMSKKWGTIALVVLLAIILSPLLLVLAILLVFPGVRRAVARRIEIAKSRM